MDESIISRFSQPQRIAVVGVSPGRKGFGYTVFKTLLKRGYDVVPVHLSGETVDDRATTTSLSSLDNVPESAVVVVQPDAAVEVVDDAARAGVKNLWFQQGADFSQAANRATDRGLSVVTNRCILMYSQPVTGIHAFHRFLHDLFSRR
jgi:predicted CoA-binding protein